jgi:hypothetical protein
MGVPVLRTSSRVDGPLSPASRPGLLTAGPAGLKQELTARAAWTPQQAALNVYADASFSWERANRTGHAEERCGGGHKARAGTCLYRFANGSAPSSCGFIRKAVTPMTRMQTQTGLNCLRSEGNNSPCAAFRPVRDRMISAQDFSPGPWAHPTPSSPGGTAEKEEKSVDAGTLTQVADGSLSPLPPGERAPSAAWVEMVARTDCGLSSVVPTGLTWGGVGPWPRTEVLG